MKLWACGFILLVVVGCSSTPKEQSSSVSADDITATEKPKEWPKMPIFKNEKGSVICPVMKNEISEPDHAIGFQDYKGTRYYFCCDMCPDQFKKNPEKYLAQK